MQHMPSKRELYVGFLEGKSGGKGSRSCAAKQPPPNLPATKGRKHCATPPSASENSTTQHQPAFYIYVAYVGYLAIQDTKVRMRPMSSTQCPSLPYMHTCLLKRTDRHLVTHKNSAPGLHKRLGPELLSSWQRIFLRAWMSR